MKNLYFYDLLNVVSLAEQGINSSEPVFYDIGKAVDEVMKFDDFEKVIKENENNTDILMFIWYIQGENFDEIRLCIRNIFRNLFNIQLSEKRFMYKNKNVQKFKAAITHILDM